MLNDHPSVTGDEVAKVAALFRLLADPSRVGLLQILLESGEMSVGQLAAAVGASESAVSQALRLLRNAEVVQRRRDGRTMYYHLADEHVRRLLALSLDHIRHDGHEGEGH